MAVFDVFTDLPPSAVTEVGFAVMMKWIAFAMGKDSINGRRIAHPTGRYASSIRLEGHGPNHIAVVADESVAPEAGILESGHAEVDLKQKLVSGRAYPLHRGAAGDYGSAGYGAPIHASSFSARAKNVWAAPRSEGFSGYRRIPSKITPENSRSWIIPAMTAWHPAEYLAEGIRNGEFDARA